ncbi:MAG TPA: T9SS type A sorting domain-containing protein [Saprospiraceae bacterium]|nr:T9SS type A sorting domain-containing protein [Saprospiraceae bacterium]
MKTLYTVKPVTTQKPGFYRGIWLICWGILASLYPETIMAQDLVFVPKKNLNPIPDHRPGQHGGAPENLICNDLIYIALGDDCIEEINPDMILEGTYQNYNEYQVDIDFTLPLGNGPWLPGIVDVSHIGGEYLARVTHLPSGNTCTCTIRVQDNTPPDVQCLPITVGCNVPDLSPQYLLNFLNLDDAYPSVIDCQSFTLNWLDSEIPQNCNSGFTRVIHRVWTATDESGNSATCQQVIQLLRPNLNTLDLPPNYDDIALPAFDCEVPYPTPEWIENQGMQGVPYFMDFPVSCSVSASHSDVLLEVCKGSYTIVRHWTIVDGCSGMVKLYNQTIRVIDKTGPVFDCPADIEVSINPFDCCANTDLPDIIIRDDCSGTLLISALIETFDPDSGNPLNSYQVSGTLENFPGNNLWDSDTLGVFGDTPCLPIGNQQVTYVVQDDCGNTSSCLFAVAVVDLVPPVASCDEFTTVALTNNGMALINASTFDDGSYDKCCLDRFEVARTEHNTCSDTLFGPTVKFCCSDIGDTIMVTFRVFDCNGNYNDCMVSVEVQDKVKPVCLPPSQVTVSCENFDPSLWSYGLPQVSDNCCLDSTKMHMGQPGLLHSVNYSLFDTVCNKGTITRTFRVFDCNGNSSQCTQRILVNYEQDYFIRFPDDVVVTVCDGTGAYGTPVFFGEDCELLGVSFSDVVYTVVPDACFKIERSWNIINWCTYNPNQPCIEVPNPNPHTISSHPTNLPGPVVSACGTLAPWAPTVIRILPSDPAATNFCQYYQANANCYRYKQIIKVIDQQAPTGVFEAPDCTNQNWLTDNNQSLWNENYWWDPGVQSHDLCEEPTNLCITATDACSGANINIEYLLFLDLDQDGVMETVVNSVNTGLAGLGWNRVLYNNLTTPNFSGGVVRSFDQRPVAPNQLYGFAIEEAVNGTVKTACVRWNTQQQQNTYIVPELPHGTHKIKWFITDGCGNNKEYEYVFTVKDCKAPTVVCRNALSVNIMPTGMIQLYAADFLQHTTDNCTPADQLTIGIRKCGQGTGFPWDANGNPITSLTFDCSEQGLNCVEIWAIDAAGNADHCNTTAIVQDVNAFCSPGNTVVVAGSVKTADDQGVEEAQIQFSGLTPTILQLSQWTDESGAFQHTIPLASNISLTPVKQDNPLNGVTTYDLVQISKHILGLEPLNSPYKMIAADANKSGSITTFDIVELRKLILGIYTSLPTNDSWRFVDKSFQFPVPNNPFQSPFPESMEYTDLSGPHLSEHFIGVKIGDVNGSVLPNAQAVAPERQSQPGILDLEDRELEVGEEFELTFTAESPLIACQMTLELDGLEPLGVVPAENVTAENFGMGFQGALTVSLEQVKSFSIRFRATRSGSLSGMIGLSNAITQTVAYTWDEVLGKADARDLMLRFDGAKHVSCAFELFQNEPNPFYNRTSIGFFLPEAGEIVLSIFDETGRMVFRQKGYFDKGAHQVLLDRSVLHDGGLYFYQMETENEVKSKKMFRIK